MSITFSFSFGTITSGFISSDEYWIAKCSHFFICAMHDSTTFVTLAIRRAALILTACIHALHTAKWLLALAFSSNIFQTMLGFSASMHFTRTQPVIEISTTWLNKKSRLNFHVHWANGTLDQWTWSIGGPLVQCSSESHWTWSIGNTGTDYSTPGLIQEIPD